MKTYIRFCFINSENEWKPLLSVCISDGSHDDKEMHGRFSGASSPWYTMMMSSNDDEDDIEIKKSARKKKFLPKIKMSDKGIDNQILSKYFKSYNLHS